MADLNTNTEADAIVMQKALFSTDAFTMKANGDGRTGVVDWGTDDATGYLFHLRTLANTTALSAALAIGTDRGAGHGLLISHKNTGAGIIETVQPGAGIGVYLQGFSVNQSLAVEHYTGSGGVTIQPKSGQGFADGVANGTTTFTSATAVFTANDVGAVLAQKTSRDAADPYVIPAGTTIVSRTNATTVELSAPATGNATGIIFSITGGIGTNRQPASTENMVRLLNFAGTAAWRLTTVGRMVAQGSSRLDNAQNTTTMGADIATLSTGQSALIVTGTSGQAADIALFKDGAAANAFRINQSGRPVFLQKTTVPTGELSASQFSFWIDDTPASTKLMASGKDSAGTLKQLTIGTFA